MPTVSEQAEGARGHRPSPVHSTGVLFLCWLGKTENQISAAVLLPLLSCLPKAHSIESGLTCAWLCPQEPMQL